MNARHVRARGSHRPGGGQPGLQDLGACSINLHICPGTLKHASRVLKETKSIADAGLVDRVCIAAIWGEGLEEEEQLDGRRELWRVRLSLPGGKGLVLKGTRHLEWGLRILARYRKKPIKFVNCHSLAVLPIGIVLGLLCRSRVIYDTHELETETATSVGLRKPVARLLERALIGHVDAVITVNASIADWYRRRYGLTNIHVVRNVPYRRETSGARPTILRDEFGLQQDEMLFIYQGGLDRDRGIEMLLEVFAEVDPRKHVVFMGYGPLEGLVREYQHAHPNVHFRPAVSPQAVQEYTSSADVGLCVYENVCLNHWFCLPNKVFEYIMSGLALVVSDFPEMGRLVDDAGCGWKVGADREALRSLIAALTWEDVRARRDNALRYRQTLGWGNEEAALLRVYRKLADRSGALGGMGRR